MLESRQYHSVLTPFPLPGENPSSHDWELMRNVEPVLWTRDGLKRLTGFDMGQNWQASGISDDGQVIVGIHWPKLDADVESEERVHSAFVWQADRVTLLGSLPGMRHSEAFAVSGDGRVIGGRCFNRENGKPHVVAFVWDRRHGMRSLSEVLARESVIPAGWMIQSVKGISHDGTVLIGEGFNPEGLYSAWRAMLSTNVFDGDDGLAHDEATDREAHQ